MPAAANPPGEARTEFDIYCTLSRRLGNKDDFSEGLDETGWLLKLWEETQETASRNGIALPDWDDFLRGDIVMLPDPSPDQVFLSDYRADPAGCPLPTPSGRIELFSETIAAMQLPDCPGHATWFPPRDRAAGRDKDYPLALLSGQPATRLHSQLDNGMVSLAAKIKGREPVLVHPADAEPRGISDGDVIEIFNDRGRCLAGARITSDIGQGCIFLWTGAWYDPDLNDPHRRDRHGNPNVLTHDRRTSSLTQSPAAHSAQVDIAPLNTPPPAVEAHDPPQFTFLDSSGTFLKNNSDC